MKNKSVHLTLIVFLTYITFLSSSSIAKSVVIKTDFEHNSQIKELLGALDSKRPFRNLRDDTEKESPKINSNKIQINYRGESRKSEEEKNNIKISNKNEPYSNILNGISKKADNLNNYNQNEKLNNINSKSSDKIAQGKEKQKINVQTLNKVSSKDLVFNSGEVSKSEIAYSQGDLLSLQQSKSDHKPVFKKTESHTYITYPDINDKTLWKPANCFTLINNNIYNLYPLRNKPLNILAEEGYKIDINLCKDITADNGKRAMVIIKSKGVTFSDRFIKDKLWAEENGKLYIDLPLGDYCNAEETQRYQTTLILKCNPAINDPVIRNTNSGNDAVDKKYCRNFIKIETKEACSKGEFVFWYNLLGIKQSYTAGALILIGLIFILFGNKFAAISSGIVIALSSTVILKVLIGLLVELDIKTCLTAGVTLAVVTVFYPSLRHFLLSMALGFFIGNIGYDFLLQISSMDPFLLYWASIGGGVAFVLVFTILFTDAIVVVTTSAFGSYILVRGVSLFGGGFPDETFTSKLIMYGELNQLGHLMDARVVLYLSCMGGLFLFGCLFQGCTFGAKKEKNESLLVDN